MVTLHRRGGISHNRGGDRFGRWSPVYDFRKPGGRRQRIPRTEIDEGWQQWDAERYVKALDHPVAESGFRATSTRCTGRYVCARATVRAISPS